MPSGVYTRSQEYRLEVSARNKSLGIKPVAPLHARDDQNSNWRGDKASYRARHYWIQSKRGTPGRCENCGRNDLSGRKIHWASKSRKCLRDESDWIRLCVPCHKHHDLALIQKKGR
jgi:hypothetical protein